MPAKNRKGKKADDSSDEEEVKKPAKTQVKKGKKVESSSSSEDEAPKKKPAPKKGGKKKVESSSEESSSEEEAPKKPAPKKGKAKKVSSSEESSSEEEKPKKKAPPKKAAAKKKVESSSEESSSEDEAPKKKPAPKKGKAKKVSSSEESSSEEEKPKKKAPPKKAAAKKKVESSSEESSSEEEQPKKKAAAKKADNNEDKKADKKAPAKKQAESGSEDSDEDKEKKTWYNSDDEKKATKIEADFTGLTRKERKALEKKLKEQAQYEAEVAAKENSSPFSVQIPGDALANMGDNVRNVILNEVSVHVRGVELFRNVDVKFVAGRRYGLVGPNGKGKSTLLNLLNTREIPMPKNLHVLLVAQEQEVDAMDTPAVQVVIESDTRRLQMLADAEKLEKKAEKASNEEAAEIMAQLKEVQDELNAMGAYSADARARRILTGLGFPHDWHERPTRSFSGGWRKRIALACAVFMEPDFLMLDEPTNHLDLNAVIWLETYLPIMYCEHSRKKPKTLIVVSHDVSFLDNVCSDTVHIDNMKLNYYKGSYDMFMKGRGEQASEHDRAFHKQQNQIKTWKAQGKSKKQIEEMMKTFAQRDGKSLEDVVLNKRRDYIVNFPFSEPPELREAYIVKMSDVSFHYPNCENLFENLNLAIWTDSRITLCGPNGIGKTTLLNLMAGLLEPTDGGIERNHLVRVARYSQHFVDSVPLDKTGVDYLQKQGLGEEFKCRQVLGSFGLESARHLEKIGNLSGGQKARVAFAGLSVTQPHLLLLDEPTNHLDMESIEALASAINKFKGGVLLVTHDARLIQQTVNEIWVMGNKTVDTQSFSAFEDYKAHLLELMEMEALRKEEMEEERDEERERKAAAKAKAKEEEKNAKKEAKKKQKEAEEAEEDGKEETEKQRLRREQAEQEEKERKVKEEEDKKKEEEKKAAAKNKLNKLFAKKK